MDHLAALQSFVRVVELGSLTKAATERGMKVSTVSRHLAALETDLAAALLNRSTHGIALTEIGSVFYADATRILADLDEARERAASGNRRPQGRLKITMPTAFGRLHVVPHLADFMAAFPSVSIEATLADAHLDLIESGMDLAIRIGALPDSALVARKLAPHARILCAAPALLRSSSVPARPEDLAGRDVLLFALQAKRTWSFRERTTGETMEVDVSGRLMVNDTEALLACAIAGQGFALLPQWAVHDAMEHGKLVAVLPGWDVAIGRFVERAIWAIYPPKRTVAPKVRVFIDFLEARYRAPRAWRGTTDASEALPPAMS